jgi:hypothetical protein
MCAKDAITNGITEMKNLFKGMIRGVNERRNVILALIVIQQYIFHFVQLFKE